VGRAACAAAVVAAFSTPAHARGSRRRVAGYQEVELATVRSIPRAFIGKRVSFESFFAGLGRIYQPFQTPFVAEQYLNFHVWAPGTRLWDDDERRDAYLFCYVPRSLDKQASYIMSLRPYDSIRLFGVVSVVYDDQPWFEIEDVEASPMPSYTETALKHILVGIRSLRGENFPMAKESFEKAIDAGLPRSAQSFAKQELGKTYYELEMFGQAADALAEAAWIAGADPQIMLLRGQALSRAADAEETPKLKQRMLNEAQRHLENARTLEPANAQTHAETGWVIAKLGNPAEGIRYCKHALAVRQNASTYRILAKINWEIGKFSEAEKYYAQAILLDASKELYHRELADLYMEQGKYAEAVKERRNVVVLTPTEPSGYILRAEARRMQGDLKGAATDYQEARRRAPENVEALLGLAETHAELKEYERAKEVLNEARLVAPKDVNVLVASADVLRVKGDQEEAVAAYRDILRKKPPKEILPDVYYGLGVALGRQKAPRLSEAASWLQKTCGLDARHAEAREALGRTHMKLGRFQLAVKYLDELKRLRAADESGRVMLARAKAEAGDFKGATSELRALLRDRPDSSRAKNNLAFLLAEFGAESDLPEAARLAQAAYDSDPANAAFQDTLGWLKYKSGDAEAAGNVLDLALIKAEAPDAFYHYAFVKKELGDVEEARQKTEEAIRRLKEAGALGAVGRRLQAQVRALARQVGASLNPGPR
jgi:tetratricopeptide (TPR) repeat protein